MIARVYIQGKVYRAQLLRKDTTTYIATLLIMRLLNCIDFVGMESTGDYSGDKIAIFENGDKFMEWEG